jgi:type IV secretory pathway VirB9-like protein
MTGKIVTAIVFVILASTFALAEEPAPSASPTAPPVLAQSPRAGVIEAATPAATPAVPPPRRQQKPDGKRVAFVAADDTDDGYVVTGTADWKPVTVYSKGGKTYIEMPESVRHKEAPVLFEETRKGWFHHEKILVNYRVKGRWYVADKVIDKGILVSGVGSNQTRVDIRHVETKKPVTTVKQGEEGK